MVQRSKYASLADWDLRSGRNVFEISALSVNSLADWDLRSGRNIFSNGLVGGDSLADWDLRSGRNFKFGRFKV